MFRPADVLDLLVQSRNQFLNFALPGEKPFFQTTMRPGSNRALGK
jgi:hypothetical protein